MVWLKWDGVIGVAVQRRPEFWEGIDGWHSNAERVRGPNLSTRPDPSLIYTSMYILRKTE